MPTAQLPSSPEQRLLHGVAVFIVEDEPLLMMEAEDQVRDLGCDRILSASSSESARIIAEQDDFDLALLDVNLGGTTISEVAGIVAGNDRPIVFVTGYADDFRLACPRSAVLAKPYSPASLQAALTEALDARSRG